MSTIGLFIPGVLNHDYLGEVFQGVSDTAQQHRCSLLTSIQNPTRQDDIARLLPRCDGVVMVVPHDFAHLLDLCRESGIPSALIDFPVAQRVDDLLTVEVTNREAMIEVVQHLVSLGHRRIGFITGSMEHGAGVQRLLGYQQALEAAGIVYEPSLVVNGGWVQPTSFLAARKLLELESPPTAIAASCDASAFGVYQAAHERGLEIGRQLSVTGFNDGSQAAAASPSLTTVRQPAYGLGQTAVEMLIQQIEGVPLPERHVRLKTELIIRQSTGSV